MVMFRRGMVLLLVDNMADDLQQWPPSFPSKFVWQTKRTTVANHLPCLNVS